MLCYFACRDPYLVEGNIINFSDFNKERDCCAFAKSFFVDKGCIFKKKPKNNDSIKNSYYEL